MSNYVHLKVTFHPPKSRSKRTLQVKVDAERWDSGRFNHASYINGHLQASKKGGMGSRIVTWEETKRTKT